MYLIFQDRYQKLFATVLEANQKFFAQLKLEGTYDAFIVLLRSFRIPLIRVYKKTIPAKMNLSATMLFSTGWVIFMKFTSNDF